MSQALDGKVVSGYKYAVNVTSLTCNAVYTSEVFDVETAAFCESSEATADAVSGNWGIGQSASWTSY